MSPLLILGFILCYFLLLIGISYLTGRDDNNAAFFLGNKKSPWYVVAFGMIGASLSGVTFISVPGWVEASQFSYMQTVLGYLIGYFVIAFVLMPIYYRLNLTSIYSYLEQRFGFWSYKTGAFYFLLSRIIGASFRLYLVATVLQEFVFKTWGVPFEVTVILTILFIWLYTFRGGIKTIIWTDTLQTLFMLIAVGVSIYLIADDLNLGLNGIVETIAASDYSQMFFWGDIREKSHFIKQLLSGAFIAICMTGLDQDMMQKNISCKNVKEAQKNMVSFSIVLVFVNLVFLGLGALLFIYANAKGISVPEKKDLLYPTIALNSGLGIGLGVCFILGLVAAAYSSADSALTSLTTSVCVDFLDIQKKEEDKQKALRKKVHVLMSLVLLVVIVLFNYLIKDSVIHELLKIASYTYGPLLGLYAFGLFTKRKVNDLLVPVVCVIAPVLTYIIGANSREWLFGYQFAYELLAVNGLLTFIGLLFLKPSVKSLNKEILDA
ncbi:MAG: sodium:solute symporter [Flavobacteriales bacterium]|nr:sodium:solute symporter [Bacteroidales bacterium AH-315-I05]PCJ84459.1 MAG: sodium:solute symporter [Flavobacteriales bacterium]